MCTAWLAIGDFGHINGMVETAREAADQVKVVVVGTQELAEAAAMSGPDELYWFEAGEKLPGEALAAQASALITEGQPRMLLCLEDAVSRTIWAQAVIRLQASAVGTLFAIEKEEGNLKAKRLIADDRTIEIAETAGILAGIYNGKETDPPGKVTPITKVEPKAESGLVAFAPGVQAQKEEENRLKAAKRVIGVGYGVTKSQLEDISEIARLLDAEIGCSLPVANQLGWFDESRVVGVTHNNIAPELYIALGISGQPQHMYGVRDAKVVVGVNIDPEASIFKRCDYGIAEDAGKIIPALLETAKSLKA